MNRKEFASLLGYMDQLWPHNNDRPVFDPTDADGAASQAFVAYFNARHPVVAHIPLGEAMQAVLALVRHRKYEPPLAEIVRYAERAMGIAPATGQSLSWPEAQSLMNAAIKTYSATREQPSTH